MQGETRLLKVFTMNCWGIPLVSKNRHERITALADHLATCDYDFVCLQELWSEYDYHFIKEKTVDSLPYSHYFHSGVLGSGLCVLSRFPIEDVFFHQWPMNGYMHKLQHGDWFGGKGIGVCRIQLEDVYVNVYTAHLHAEYNPSNDEYLAHRVLQALDAAQFVRLTAAGSDVAILGGDLNALPGDLAQRIICLYAELEDSCCVAHPMETHKNFGTNETAANSYTGKKVAREQPEGKRIDYIMFRTSSRVKVERVQYKHPLPDRVPQHSFSYSDHDAVLATLELSVMSPEAQPQIDEPKPDPIPALTEGVAVCGSALRQLRRSRRIYWVFSVLFFVVVVCATVFDAPEAYDKILDVVIAVASILFCFTLFMCSLWNPIEVNAIRAGKLAMEVTLAAAELRLAGFVAQMEAAGAEHRERCQNSKQTRQSLTSEVDEGESSMTNQSDVLSNRSSRQSKCLLVSESKKDTDMGSRQLLLSESMDIVENHTGQPLLQETRHNSQGEHRQSVLIPNFSFLHKCWFRADSKS
ncbi:putative neutral sphingomyelinase [Schistocerca piceifrons]|uniref:putative neutral sphingomyelinase n=1 Tax=Schistocerca piceifrons TaxID=274613 RepID=UPI001F5F43F2|nr:putative neutral sphingomyelinase [Schistocerca piceifrons]